MTPEQIKRNREFIKDLRANDGLEARCVMRQPDGSRCCLAVALDTAVKLGFVPESAVDNYNATPPPELGQFYGWETRNPLLRYQENQKIAAMSLNDEASLSHSQIADCFELTFLKTQPA